MGVCQWCYRDALSFLMNMTRERIIFIFIILALLFYINRTFILTYYEDPQVPFQAKRIDMEVDSSKFWEDRNEFYGYTKHAAEGLEEKTCHDFFALWPSDCVDRYDDLQDKMTTLSAQMQIMDSTLTLYATEAKGCHFTQPRIQFKAFNATELLIETGFEDTFKEMDTWVKTRYTRISDILRLGLAYKYQQSYIDTDIAFLQLNKDLYERSYVGAAIWKNAKNAIEISNGAFCLPKHILYDMMAWQRTRILKGGKNYFYTEFGPSMFHNVLMNHHSVMLYSQNAPAEPNLDTIARSIHQYGHKQLHLTGHVRKGNADLSFGSIVNVIRKKSGLPLLDYSLDSDNKDSPENLSSASTFPPQHTSTTPPTDPANPDNESPPSSSSSQESSGSDSKKSDVDHTKANEVEAHLTFTPREQAKQAAKDGNPFGVPVHNVNENKTMSHSSE